MHFILNLYWLQILLKNHSMFVQYNGMMIWCCKITGACGKCSGYKARNLDFCQIKILTGYCYPLLYIKFLKLVLMINLCKDWHSVSLIRACLPLYGCSSINKHLEFWKQPVYALLLFLFNHLVKAKHLLLPQALDFKS